MISIRYCLVSLLTFSVSLSEAKSFTGIYAEFQESHPFISNLLSDSANELISTNSSGRALGEFNPTTLLKMIASMSNSGNGFKNEIGPLPADLEAFKQKGLSVINGFGRGFIGHFNTENVLSGHAVITNEDLGVIFENIVDLIYKDYLNIVDKNMPAFLPAVFQMIEPTSTLFSQLRDLIALVKNVVSGNRRVLLDHIEGVFEETDFLITTHQRRLAISDIFNFCNFHKLFTRLTALIEFLFVSANIPSALKDISDLLGMVSSDPDSMAMKVKGYFNGAAFFAAAAGPFIANTALPMMKTVTSWISGSCSDDRRILASFDVLQVGFRVLDFIQALIKSVAGVLDKIGEFKAFEGLLKFVQQVIASFAGDKGIKVNAVLDSLRTIILTSLVDFIHAVDEFIPPLKIMLQDIGHLIANMKDTFGLIVQVAKRIF